MSMDPTELLPVLEEFLELGGLVLMGSWSSAALGSAKMKFMTFHGDADLQHINEIGVAVDVLKRVDPASVGESIIGRVVVLGLAPPESVVGDVRAVSDFVLRATSAARRTYLRHVMSSLCDVLSKEDVGKAWDEAFVERLMGE